MYDINKLLTKNQIEKINRDFENTDFGNRGEKLLKVLENCDETEKTLLKFLYAYMPVSDLASYDGEIFADAVKSSLYAIERVKWGDKITGELFLNFVLSFRLNNEDLVPYKRPIFDELFPRIKDITMEQAVLEVNYWCFEKATYQSTDIRTSSPFNVMRNAFGRCGEESVLCVAALRSVGIPARQCYTPRWAHCDDNHAWVEVWVDGKWHFIGACEPEPVLDKGWFAGPAQRGMLIHARVFSNLVSEGEITLQTPVMTQLNILDNYTKTRKLTVCVTENGKPKPNVSVAFELINFAQLYPLATLKTDENGIAAMTTGQGDLWIHVTDGKRFIHKKADMRIVDRLDFDFAQAISAENDSFDLDMVPPEALDVHEPKTTPELEAAHAKRTEQCTAIRREFESTFLHGEKAEAFAAQFSEFKAEISNLIACANGNHREIAAFLKDNFAPLKFRVAFLKALNKKDLSDSSCAVLKSHLSHAMQFADRFDDDFFIKYIASPRVYFEMICEYRDYLENYFDDTQKAEFIKNPFSVYKYINENIADCGERDYSTISASPSGLLELGCGSLMSKRILFAAICRTLGIPARVSPIDLNPEFFTDGKWNIISLSKDIDRDCELTLINPNPQKPLEYEKDFTLAFLENGEYQTLGLTDISFDGDRVTYQLKSGEYRITTALRLTDGTILANISHLSIESGAKKSAEITMREPVSNSENAVALTDIKVISDGVHTTAAELLKKGETTAVAWLEEGLEPTEHILNEILEAPADFKKMKNRFLLLVKSQKSLENKTLKKVIDETALPYAILDCGEETLSALLSELNAKSAKLPLIMALNEESKCVFHTTGYNVGTGNHLLKHFGIK